MDEDQQPLVYSVDQICRMLQIGRSSVYEHLGKSLPVVRIGRRVLVRREDLERFLEQHREPLELPELE